MGRRTVKDELLEWVLGKGEFTVRELAEEARRRGWEVKTVLGYVSVFGMMGILERVERGRWRVASKPRPDGEAARETYRVLVMNGIWEPEAVLTTGSVNRALEAARALLRERRVVIIERR
jgi:sugar/nucleoside kinase (ribokinase family)